MGVLMALFHLWANTIGVIPEFKRNALHFGFILCMGFILYSGSKKSTSAKLKYDYVFSVLSFLMACYLIFFENALHARNEIPTVIDLIFAGCVVLLILEMTFRTAGSFIPLLATLFLGYSLCFGKFFGGVWMFRGVPLSRLLYRMAFTSDGILGTLATISSTFVFLFVLFGAFLIKSGGGDFIIKLAMSLMGRTRGGPAKMAVVASGLMGSISGSAVANTVGTGSITIPLMKRSGFSPRFSAAVEAAASTGGQLMPPIMGAGAFIMSQWTKIPYLTIVGVAFIPAVLYFLSILFMIHIRAQKAGLSALKPSEVPRFSQVLKEGWNFFIPVAVLIGFLAYGFTSNMSACAAIFAIILASWLNKKTRMGLKDILDALYLGSKNMVTTGVILLCSGIIVGIVLLVGMGIKLSMLITALSGNHLPVLILLIALTSLILGMGLPVTASYIVLATLVAPAMQIFGVSLIASHMLIFWYSQDANVTPPICLAAYSAAGIAGSRPLATSLEAWKLSKGLYIIPLLFCYTPLLFEGPLWQVVETTAAAVLGFFAFALFFEGYLKNKLNWLARILCGVAALCLFWPNLVCHGAGILLLFVSVYFLKSFR
jgi:TRAP transporter 4TM/12TM fusion protein